MYRGCETLFRAITLNIIFYLPANYRISFSACRPARPCSPHFGEARGMVPSLTRLCLICSYIFTWHLPSKNHSLLFPPSLHIAFPTSLPPLIRGPAALPWRLHIPVFTNIPPSGKAVRVSVSRGALCFGLHVRGCKCSASLQPRLQEPREVYAPPEAS